MSCRQQTASIFVPVVSRILIFFTAGAVRLSLLMLTLTCRNPTHVFATLSWSLIVQVTILVSVLASPVVSLFYVVINRGPGDLEVRTMLWSQAFIVLTAVSLAWSMHGVITLQKIIATADAAAAAAAKPCAMAAGGETNDDRASNNVTGSDEVDGRRRKPSQVQGQAQGQAAAAAQPAGLCPESWIITAAEAILSGRPGSADDEDAALATLNTAVAQVRLQGLTVDTPVLQTANSLHAWSKVVSHQGEVERDIRETDRWGVFEQNLISMNAGMPFMVGIIQARAYDTMRSSFFICVGGR